MPKALRYRANGQFMQHTLFWTQADYIGAYHAQPDVFDADLAAEEEAQTIASHQQDFAVAFGIPADQIEAVTLAWDGNPDTLPYADDASAPVVRLPVDAPPALPDVHAFEEAVLKAIGPLRGNTIYAKYPLFLRALDKSDWGDARALLGVALQAQDITQEEHDTIASAMTAAAIP